MKHIADLLKPLMKGLPDDTHWLVGGLLRDASLKRPLNDVDIAVKGNALKSAQKFGVAMKKKPFPLDAERGTYRVVIAHGAETLNFDFSQLQGAGIQQDLQRRDFTINAMALPIELIGAKDWSKHVLDPFEGGKDLRSRKIRLVRESALKEDPLRILRAYRFSAELGFAIENTTAAALKKNAKLLSKPAAERVRDELFKILATPCALPTIIELDRAGVLAVIFPEAEAMRKSAHEYYGQQGVLGHCLDALGSLDKLMSEIPSFFPTFQKPLMAYLNEPIAGFPRVALLKLVELLHDVGKPATAKVENGKLHFHGHDHLGMQMMGKIGTRLRLSNEATKSAGKLIQAHMRPGNLSHQPVLTDRAVFRFYRDLQEDAVAMLIVALADHLTYLSDKQRKGKKDPVFLTIQKMLSRHYLQPETIHPPKIIDGSVLMSKLKLMEGPLIGRLLNAIKEAQATRKVKTADQALQLAEKLAASEKFRKAGSDHLDAPPKLT